MLPILHLKINCMAITISPHSLVIRTDDAPGDFCYLPVELHILILEWLDHRTLANLRGVCQYFCNIVDTEGFFQKAYNSPFISRIIQLSSKATENSIPFSIPFLQDLLIRFSLSNLIQQKKLNNNAIALNPHHGHDYNLLWCVCNQADLQKWRSGYSLLKEFQTPIYRLAGYFVLLEYGGSSVLEAYPLILTETTDLIATLDSKWHQTYLLLLLSFILANSDLKKGEDLFKEAKNILLDVQIPTDDDLDDFFFCIQRLGTHAILFNDMDVLRLVSEYLCKHVIEEEENIDGNDALELACDLCASQDLLQRRKKHVGETIPLPLKEIIETCLQLVTVVPSKSKQLLLEKMAFFCIETSFPIPAELQALIDQSPKHSFQIDVLLKLRKQNPSKENEEKLQKCLEDWRQSLQTFSWRSRANKLEVEKKTEELTTFIEISVQLNFQKKEALQLLDNVKKLLHSSFKSLALVKIAAFESRQRPEQLVATLETICSKLPLPKDRICQTTLAIYNLSIEIANLENFISQDKALIRLGQLKAKALSFLGQSHMNEKMVIELLIRIALAEAKVQSSAENASATLSEIQKLLAAKFQKGSVKMAEKCAPLFSQVMAAQLQVKPASSFERLVELDAIFIKYAEKANSKDALTETSNTKQGTKRKREPKTTESKSTLPKRQKYFLSNGTLFDARINVFYEFFQGKPVQNPKDAEAMISRVSNLNHDLRATRGPKGRSIQRLHLSKGLLNHSHVAAWPIIQSIEVSSMRALAMIYFKTKIEQ